MNPRDFNKEERRKPKGAAAQLASLKRKMEEQARAMEETEMKKIKQAEEIMKGKT